MACRKDHENNDEGTKLSFSFGFSKKKEPKRLKSSAIKDEEGATNANDATFVESFDGKRLKTDEKEKFVIPLIKNNRWQNPVKPEDLEKDKKLERVEIKLVEGDTVESQAANEILRAAAKDDENENKREETVPLLLQGRVLDGNGIDDRLNVHLRPESSVDADYEQVPIEQYGQALLRGMGWTEGMGVGKKGRVAKPIEAVARPKGLGLGADRNVNKQSTGSDPGQSKDSEDLELKKGVHCLINNGRCKGMYGVVEGIEEDNARAIVKLTLTKESITISQYAITVVSKKEFEKNSKVLNKAKVDKFKKDQEKQRKGPYDEDESDDKARYRDSQRDKHRDRKDKGRDESRHRGKHREEDRASSQHRDKRKHQDSGSESKKYKTSPSQNMWLRPHLRVRVVDPEYKKGIYFKTKVVIEDVIGPGECICRTDEGKVLENISISMLETVIPKHDPAYIMVVSGKHVGKLAAVLKKNKASCEATVQLLHDRDQVLQLSFDDICDYAGDIDHEFDY